MNEWVKDNVPFCIFIIWTILMSIVEFSKIKINPWSAVFNAIGRAFTKPVVQEIQTFKNEVEELKQEVEQEKKERAQDACFSYRNTIINDANSLRRGDQFTRSKYNTLIDMHTRYNNLVDKNNLPNDVLEYDFEYIMERMKEADENGEFM